MKLGFVIRFVTALWNGLLRCDYCKIYSWNLAISFEILWRFHLKFVAIWMRSDVKGFWLLPHYPASSVSVAGPPFAHPWTPKICFWVEGGKLPIMWLLTANQSTAHTCAWLLTLNHVTAHTCQVTAHNCAWLLTPVRWLLTTVPDCSHFITWLLTTVRWLLTPIPDCSQPITALLTTVPDCSHLAMSLLILITWLLALTWLRVGLLLFPIRPSSTIAIILSLRSPCDNFN